ncbi:hypothetical protein ACHAXA_004578 [Cyclostephanos tholiformis]|uniref:SAP domain-containing protein n=1 Tax=Cyclostephanos tholiformis TaxID=382380 RepID=A0ABD3R6Y7_9STRA
MMRLYSLPIIDKVLSSRLDTRKRRAFNEADVICDVLLNVHGISVWDKDRTWSTGGGGGGGRERGSFDQSDCGGRGGCGGRYGREGRGSGRGRGRERQVNVHGHDYSMVGGPVNPASCKLSETEIHDLIRERIECKFARDFNSADRIERDLRMAGVVVDDGSKECRENGEEMAYHQCGAGHGLSFEQIAKICELVAERSEAKAAMDYDRADEIFNYLTREYEINIDNRASEWALLHEEYIFNADMSSFIPDNDKCVMIGKKLGERILARKRRDFDLADDIRDKLCGQYVVEIDDRSKEWMVIAPKGGRWLNDDNEIKDNSNIVSKEEWDKEEDEEVDANGIGFVDETAYNDDPDISIAKMKAGESNSVDSPSSTSDLSDEHASLSTMTIPELKERLREVGLPVSGKKSELITRLIEAYNNWSD